MKKYLLLLLVLLSFNTAKALKIEELGFKSDDIKGIEITTRNNSDNIYFMKENDMFGYSEGDNYYFYIRAIKNPGIKDYSADEDLIDEVFGLLSKVNSKTYSYIPHGDYKWIRFDYLDKDNKPILEYFLSWKDVFITITYISKGEEIDQDTKDKIDAFVKSISLNGKGNVPVSNVYKNGIDYFVEKNATKKSYLIEILICLTAIGITIYLTRKKK